MPKLKSAEINCIMMLKNVNYSNSDVARILGVTEGTIRYRIKRTQEGKTDGRRDRPSKLEDYRSLIEFWLEDNKQERHKKSLMNLFDTLTRHHDYSMSYDALRRYVRKHFPEYYKRGSCTRIETPPGKLLLFDWKEDLSVQLGEHGNWVKVHAAVFTLGFSRKPVIKFRFRKDLETFINVHHDAFKEFGGLPEVIRTDCLKTSVTRWNGGKTVLNETYRKYLERLGIAAFPARPGNAPDKGKVEKKILDIFSRLDIKRRVFKDLNELEQAVNAEIDILVEKWRCGSTGLSVSRSYEYEQKYLRKLPASFPAIPVRESRNKVRRDGTVFFCGNYYQMSGIYRDRYVLCQNTGTEILIFYSGEEIGRFAYLPKTKGMVVLSEDVLKDETINFSDTVRNWGIEVARRQSEIYDEIIEGVTV